MTVDFGVLEEKVKLVATIDEVLTRKAYDYIIIGGGTAGLVLANRLSEDKETTVLVLEAGRLHERDDLIDKPANYWNQLGGVDHDWSFKTVPQPNANNRSISWNRGKGLGGSSNLNFMQWTRPTEFDIKSWERLGNPGWTWNNLLPYFQKSENFRHESESRLDSAYPRLNSSWLGKNGELPLSYSEGNPEGIPHIIRAFESLGVPWINHPFGGDNFGLVTTISTVDYETKTRASSYTSFLRPVFTRPNLDVLTGATVTRLIIQNQSFENTKPITAEAVEFIFLGQTYRIDAKREIILCAGTIKSPHILELSGIGNRDILSKAGIDVKLHIPGVGENLQDHNYVRCASFELKDNPTRIVNPDHIHTSPIAFIPFKTVIQNAEKAIAIEELIPQVISSSLSLEDSDTLRKGTKEQYHILAESLSHPKIPTCEILVSHKRSLDAPKSEKEYLTFSVGGIRPWSRGSIHLKSNDPLEYPEIEPNYFEQKIDLEILLECSNILRKLKDDSNLKGIIAKEVDPGPAVSTDEEYRDYIKQNLQAFYHATGTLAMLPREKGGVVDPTLKIWGTENIRVVDLSIVPIIVSVHTQSTAYVIAEVAADIIRGKIKGLGVE